MNEVTQRSMTILLDGYPLFSIGLNTDEKILTEKLRKDWYNKNKDKINDIIKYVTVSLFEGDKFKVGLANIDKVEIIEDRYSIINCFLYSIKQDNRMIDRSILDEISNHCYKYLDELGV